LVIPSERYASYSEELWLSKGRTAMEGFSDVKDGFRRVKYRMAKIADKIIKPETPPTIAQVFSKKYFFLIIFLVALASSHWLISDL
jgi:hypothetical protein